MKHFDSNGRYSVAVIHNKTLYLCGQTGTPGKSMREQTAEVLKQVEELLLKYGSDKKHIISAMVYIEDVSLFNEMNEVWEAWVIPGYEPIRACLEAPPNDKRLLLEVVVTAAIIDDIKADE